MLLVFVSGFRAFWVYVRVVSFLSARECYWFSFLGLGPFGFMSELYFFICERMLLVFVSGLRAFWVYVRVVFLFICERMLLVFVSGFRAFWVYVRVVFFFCERMLLVFASGFRAFWVYVRVVFFYLRENAIGFRFWV